MVRGVVWGCGFDGRAQGNLSWGGGNADGEVGEIGYCGDSRLPGTKGNLGVGGDRGIRELRGFPVTRYQGKTGWGFVCRMVLCEFPCCNFLSS